MDKRFIIDVGDYLKITTPYSDHYFEYDDINFAIDDLRYCLECEVIQNEKKNEKVIRSQNI